MQHWPTVHYCSRSPAGWPPPKESAELSFLDSIAARESQVIRARARDLKSNVQKHSFTTLKCHTLQYSFHPKPLSCGSDSAELPCSGLVAAPESIVDVQVRRFARLLQGERIK